MWTCPLLVVDVYFHEEEHITRIYLHARLEMMSAYGPSGVGFFKNTGVTRE